MKLGTSLRFLYPTGPQTYERFKEVLASLPPGGFVERPMGAFDTAEQSRNVLEIAAAAREAGLDGCGVTLDRGGFVVTGAQSELNLGRNVPPLETSVPGVFAVGDVRSGSVKRVASAVGEGSMVVQFVHEYLKEM